LLFSSCIIFSVCFFLIFPVVIFGHICPLFAPLAKSRISQNGARQNREFFGPRKPQGGVLCFYWPRATEPFQSAVE
jgi:hypothetical protein